MISVDNARYNLETGTRLGEYQPLATLADDCLPFGPVAQDGRLQFTRGLDQRSGQIYILDAADQHLLAALAVMPDEDYALAMGWPYPSPDGPQLAAPVMGGAVYVYALPQRWRTK